MGGSEANQGLVLPKMAEVSFLGYILTSYSFVAWTF